MYHQLYHHCTTVANVQHLREITDAATRLLGLDLSHVIHDNHLLPTTVRELRQLYHPCNLTGKPARCLHPGTMGGLVPSARRQQAVASGLDVRYLAGLLAAQLVEQ